MRGIDFVSPVDVGGEQPRVVTCAESFDFMGGCMGSQHVCLVEVV
jgi:hypothetical protein